MVVRIQLTVKHIRGHTFQIDADVESDVLGLKVQIWESQQIAIENQRLVFGGKELQDNLKLTELGIGDNAMIFLVESNPEIPSPPQAEASQVIQMPQVTVATIGQVQSPSNINNNCANKCQYQQVGESSSYEPFDEETVLSEERMQGVIDLAFWVRRYCILGMILSGICIYSDLYALIPFFIYIFGIVGTRKLNRCLLVFPLLLVIFLGFGLTGCAIYSLITYPFTVHLLMCLFVGLLHIIIFSCVCKLMCRISKLSCQEWWQARLRIQTRSCCC